MIGAWLVRFLVALLATTSLVAGGASRAAAQESDRRLAPSARRDTELATVVAPVATRRLPRGTVLAEGDIAMARVVLRASAAGVRVAQAGWVTRRVILRGEVLREPAVAPAPLVGAGQTVQYTFRSSGIELTLEGVALNAGSLGSDVTVRLDPHRRVVGTVIGPARVESRDSRSGS